MPVPRIAIVGRPNVGKSSLLNMIARDKVSIVDPTAGTTRDRVSIMARLAPPDENIDSPKTRTVEVTDTGGFGVYVADGKRYNEVGADLASLTGDIEHQISEAVASADLVLFVIDTQQGVTPQDEQVARLLRERVLGGTGTAAAKTRATRGAKLTKVNGKASSGKGKKGSPAPVDDEVETPGDRPPDRQVHIRVVANKCDGPKWEAHTAEAANLGFGPPLMISAKSNYFRREFLDELYRAVDNLPGVEAPGAQTPEHPEMKVAIIGKRNAGKSSLVNALAGEERVIVSEIAGTTRDAVDVRFEMDGQTFVAIDTAGLRRKKSFQDSIEHFAFDRAQRSILRSDVIMLMIDATEPISQVDQQLAMLAQKAYRPVVLVVNKWDLVQGTKARAGKFKGQVITPDNYEEYLRKEFKGIEYAPIAFMSAQKGTNVRPSVRLALDLVRQSRTRIGTGKLNRILKKALDTRGPSSKLGTFAKAYFISQVAVAPPTIVLVVNKIELFTPNYRRFLLNRIREQTTFTEVPIKLIVKARNRARIMDLMEGERQSLREKGAALVGEMESAEQIELAQAGKDIGDFEGVAEVPDSDVNRHLLEEANLSDEAGEFFEDDDE
jgi:GTP-binding protein